jgi:predicted transcriptional regulator
LLVAVQLKPEQEERLQQLAAERGVTLEQVLSEVLDGYLNHMEGLMADLREGEESAERDGWLTQEEVFERLNHRLRKTA